MRTHDVNAEGLSFQYQSKYPMVPTAIRPAALATKSLQYRASEPSWVCRYLPKKLPGLSTKIQGGFETAWSANSLKTHARQEECLCLKRSKWPRHFVRQASIATTMSRACIGTILWTYICLIELTRKIDCSSYPTS